MPEKKNKTIEGSRIPMVALRGLCVFPEMLMSFDVERPASVGALAQAGKENQLIFLAAQKDLSVEVPEASDIYEVGTVCRIRQQLRMKGFLLLCGSFRIIRLTRESMTRRS